MGREAVDCFLHLQLCHWLQRFLGSCPLERCEEGVVVRLAVRGRQALAKVRCEELRLGFSTVVVFTILDQGCFAGVYSSRRRSSVFARNVSK